MPPIATDWTSQIGPLDARGPDGLPLVWPWMEGADDAVVIDLSAQLGAGEAVANPVCRCFRLRAIGEPDDAEQPLKLSGAPVVAGSTVAQRMIQLERGRYYRLEVLHGAAGNRRGASVLIRCQG